MADAISRVTSGRTIGAFCMQHGPGAENAMGGVAQCFGESVPVLVLPMGYQRRLSHIEPNFNSSEVIYAGQGVHYAQAWPQLKRLAERLAIPVTSSLGGKSSFPETHPLSLGSGGLAVPRAVPTFLKEADVIFGIGCSFTETSFGIAMPRWSRPRLRPRTRSGWRNGCRS